MAERGKADYPGTVSMGRLVRSLYTDRPLVRSNCLQEAEAAELAGMRSSAKIEALKAEIGAQVAELGGALMALDAAVQELGGALAGDKCPGTLLCLQDLQVAKWLMFRSSLLGARETEKVLEWEKGAECHGPDICRKLARRRP